MAVATKQKWGSTIDVLQTKSSARTADAPSAWYGGVAGARMGLALRQSAGMRDSNIVKGAGSETRGRSQSSMLAKPETTSVVAWRSMCATTSIARWMRAMITIPPFASDVKSAHIVRFL